MSIESHELALYIRNQPKNDEACVRISRLTNPIERASKYMLLVNSNARKYISEFAVPSAQPLHSIVLVNTRTGQRLRLAFTPRTLTASPAQGPL